MLVKAKTGNTTDTIVYNDWYKSVYMPVAAEVDDGGVIISALCIHKIAFY